MKSNIYFWVNYPFTKVWYLITYIWYRRTTVNHSAVFSISDASYTIVILMWTANQMGPSFLRLKKLLIAPACACGGLGGGYWFLCCLCRAACMCACGCLFIRFVPPCLFWSVGNQAQTVLFAAKGVLSLSTNPLRVLLLCCIDRIWT